MKSVIALSLLAGAMLFAPAAFAKDIEVQMLNKGETGRMVFEPALIHADVGDTVTFVPTDKSHNAESIAKMWPDGASKIKGKINETVTFEITQEGVFGVQCKPHFAMGMVALIVVGEGQDLSAAKKVRLPGMAMKRMKAMLSDAEAAPAQDFALAEF